MTDQELTLPGIIRLLRKRRKLTLAQLSERCEISVSYLSEIERGNANPTVQMLSDIATELGYEISFKLIPRREG